MPDTTHSEPDQLEQAITQWRSALIKLTDTQRDELEDHLRSELTELDEIRLSPRERVLITANRLGDPKSLCDVWEHESEGILLAIPRWLFAAMVCICTTFAVMAALGASFELFNEIDDPLQALYGEGFDDTAEIATNWIASILIILAGLWVLLAGLRRYRRPRHVARITVRTSHV